MNTKAAILGIDISKATFDVALLRNNKFKTKKFANTPEGFADLVVWLGGYQVIPAEVHACMEATGVYGDLLATFLHDQGVCVSVVNGARIKGFAQSELSRTKTDKKDACVIARFCEALSPEPWAPPPREIRELKALVKRLETLQDILQQEENRAAVADTILLPDIQGHIADLQLRIARTKQAIDDHIDNHPGLHEQRKLLESIPGIGPATSALLLSAFSRVENFSCAKKMAAFCGLTPRQRQSGSSLNGKAKLSKIGHRTLRKSMFFPAIVAMQYNPAIISLKNRLLGAGKCKMLIVGAAMRKLIHIIYGVLKTRTPFDRNLSAATA
jgi:transposase